MTINTYSAYSAIDISRYIINYSVSKNNFVSNLKLQRILYFVQGNFLRILNRPCFKEKILAWSGGPVIKEVFVAFERYGLNGIEFQKELNIEELNLKEEERKIIENIVDKCSGLSSVQLSHLTLSQSPWVKTYKKHEEKNDTEITLEKLKDYFCI